MPDVGSPVTDLYSDSALDPANHPVCHVEMYKLKSNMSDNQLRSLLLSARSVPGVVDLYFGRNDGSVCKYKTFSAQDNTHVFYARHENGRFLRVYQKHPFGVALSRFLIEHAEREPAVIDFVNVPSRL